MDKHTKIKMNREKTEALQSRIKSSLKKLNWSVPNFASRYYIEINDYDMSEQEIANFCEKVKKQLSRRTTKPEALEPYLEYIRNSEAYRTKFPLRTRGLTRNITNDLPIILEQYDACANTEVLAVAASYALSIGAAQDFQIIEIDHEIDESARYLVFWHADIGHDGGLGAWEISMCEVVMNSSKQYFVDNSAPLTDIRLRYLDNNTPIKYEHSQLIITGYRYADENDYYNLPSEIWEVILHRTLNGKWQITNEYKLGKREINGLN